ncbi:hypothetical protein ACET3Z_000089 [Daucus carota]
MEQAVHSRPVSEEDDEALSTTKKLKLEGKHKQHSEEEMQKHNEFDSKDEKALECSQDSEDTNKYTLVTDCRFELPHYLTEFALAEFNANQKVMYEKVNVVETMKSLNVNGVTTYFITFEASLSDETSNNVQTFQTKIIMSLLDYTTKIDVKFVRIKLSEFDVNKEEDSREKLSESNEEEDSKEKLSESNEEEDSEVSESNTEDSEASESDKEDSEELFDSDEQDTESDKKDSEQEKLSEFEEDDPKEEKLSDSDDDELCSYEMKQYLIDVEKSDGFEVGNYPHAKIPCCMIRRYYDPPGRTQSTTNLNRLVYLSRLAICVYNMKEDTYFDNVKVLKAMAFGCGCTNYNITFEASLCDGVHVTFQTSIYTSVPLPYQNIEIRFVRIKPSINPKDIST